MANFGNGIWLVESDSGNDDWISDHSGDPEDADASAFTEGTDSWYARYATVERGGSINMQDIEDLPGWTTVNVLLEEGYEIIKINGTFQGTTFAATQTKEDNLMKFFRNHSDLGDNTFYFVNRWDTDHYKQFPNEDRTMKKYCQVLFLSAPKTKIENRVLYFSFTLRSSWGA